jgi:hypothetical protein
MLSDTDAACVAIALSPCFKDLLLDQKVVPTQTTIHKQKTS